MFSSLFASSFLVRVGFLLVCDIYCPHMYGRCGGLCCSRPAIDLRSLMFRLSCVLLCVVAVLANIVASVAADMDVFVG